MKGFFEKNRLSQRKHKMLDRTINCENAFLTLKQIADTPGPSQSLLYSRRRTIERLLKEQVRFPQTYSLEMDYLGTGNVAVGLGNSPTIVFIAHADEISYLIGEETQQREVQLIPFCNHSAKNEYPAICLRYDLQEQGLRQSASGTIISRQEYDHLIPYLSYKEGTAQLGDRIIFDHLLVRDKENFVHGKIDNAAGVAACLLAIMALSEVGLEESVLFVFTDEEEGPPYENSMFARGSRRLVQRLALSPNALCVVIDGHSTPQGLLPHSSALFVEKESRCRGNVVPPHLYAEFKEFAKYIRDLGTEIAENPGYVGRSDSPGLMEYFRNILLLGYQVKDVHFDENIPCASLDAIVALAKTIVCMVLAFDPMQ